MMMVIPADLIEQLSSAGAAALSSAAPVLDPSAILDLNGLADWDKILLLARSEILGPNELQRFLDRAIGTEPCCPDCAGKDTPAKRRQTRSALNLLRRHLRGDDQTADADKLAAVVAELRVFLSARR